MKDKIKKLFISALGSSSVLDDQKILDESRMNITEYNGHNIACILKPSSIEQVKHVVQLASAHSVPLHPISTGKNWGLGSKVPVNDHTVILDLSNLKNIREYNERMRYAIIEPGVTQVMLSEYLRSLQSPLILNCTGSAKDTSIVGNCQERGMGILGTRINDIRGLEVVLPNGQIMHTGFWHYKLKNHNNIHHFSQGLGPDLTGLFTQSNFGIVTALVINLYVRQPRIGILFKFSDSCLEKIIDLLFELKENQVIRSGPFIMNENDPRRLLSEKQPREWMGICCVSGPKEIMLACAEEVKRHLTPLSTEIDFYDSTEQTSCPGIMQWVFQLTDGNPQNTSVQNLGSLYQVKIGENTPIDQIKQYPGLECCLPALPFEGKKIREALKIIQNCSSQFNIVPGISFSSMGIYAFEGFIRTVFHRDNAEEIARAHEWNKVLHRKLKEADFLPYRINVNEMDHFIDENDSFWETTRSLKKAIDPAGVIDPGRYAPKRLHHPSISSTNTSLDWNQTEQRALARNEIDLFAGTIGSFEIAKRNIYTLIDVYHAILQIFEEMFLDFEQKNFSRFDPHVMDGGSHIRALSILERESEGEFSNHLRTIAVKIKPLLEKSFIIKELNLTVRQNFQIAVEFLQNCKLLIPRDVFFIYLSYLLCISKKTTLKTVDEKALLVEDCDEHFLSHFHVCNRFSQKILRQAKISLAEMSVDYFLQLCQENLPFAEHSLIKKLAKQENFTTDTHEILKLPYYYSLMEVLYAACGKNIPILLKIRHIHSSPLKNDSYTKNIVFLAKNHQYVAYKDFGDSNNHLGLVIQCYSSDLEKNLLQEILESGGNLFHILGLVAVQQEFEYNFVRSGIDEKEQKLLKGTVKESHQLGFDSEAQFFHIEHIFADFFGNHLSSAKERDFFSVDQTDLRKIV